MNTEGAEVWMCRIVERYSDMLLRLAYSRLQSTADAEDCVQEVYLKLLRLHPAFRDVAHEKAWLIRVTLNQTVGTRLSRGRAKLKAILEEDFDELE